MKFIVKTKHFFFQHRLNYIKKQYGYAANVKLYNTYCNIGFDFDAIQKYPVTVSLSQNNNTSIVFRKNIKTEVI